MLERLARDVGATVTAQGSSSSSHVIPGRPASGRSASGRPGTAVAAGGGGARAHALSMLVLDSGAADESAGVGAHDGLQRMAAQLQAHQQGIEQLAAAVSLMAVGAAAPPAGATPAAAGSGVASAADWGFAAPAAAGEPPTPSFAFRQGAAGRAGAGAGAAQAGATGGPQLAQLGRLLAAGQVAHKMDFFDPSLLQKMVSQLSCSLSTLRRRKLSAFTLSTCLPCCAPLSALPAGAAAGGS